MEEKLLPKGLIPCAIEWGPVHKNDELWEHYAAWLPEQEWPVATHEELDKE